MSKQKSLVINPLLPQIKLPFKKQKTFIGWYNEDLRFQDIVPCVFNEGYIILEEPSEREVLEARDTIELIRKLAHEFNITYRKVEDHFKRSFSKYYIIYFNFIKDDNITCYTYNDKKKLILKFNIELNKELPCVIDLSSDECIQSISESKQPQIEDTKTYTGLVVACLWYIATASKLKNYYKYTNSKYDNDENRKININQVKDIKTINAPIYDLNKTRNINIESLKRKREGWAYSHSFQVHGHYRHYKNGKVVFIKPFIKGKQKPFKTQTIILNPRESK